jgi:hypothetical protein
MMASLSDRRTAALSDPSVAIALQSMKVSYEAGFVQSCEIEPPKYFEISDLPASTGSLVHDSGTFEHREIMGTGDTAEGAMADWKSHLDKCPQSGETLIWRIPPEIDCWCDFPSDKLIWKVYARLIIVP